MDWQPISTAPPYSEDQDMGGLFLVWNGRKVQTAARNEEGEIVGFENPDHDGAPSPIYPAPTHWAPMPDPPKC